MYDLRGVPVDGKQAKAEWGLGGCNQKVLAEETTGSRLAEMNCGAVSGNLAARMFSSSAISFMCIMLLVARCFWVRDLKVGFHYTTG